jgi:hypothetical protein
MSNDKRTLRDTIRNEYRRCLMEPAHFIKKYCKIQHPIQGNILFNMYPYQETVLDNFMNDRFNVVLKSRQTGISTLTAAYALWLILFHDDKNVLVIATKQDTAKNLVTKVRHMHSFLPVWLRGKTVEDNKLSLRFGNGSQIKATASSDEAGRSEALSLLIFDEAAFIDKIDSIWAAASLTLATGGNAIAVSTPNGMGNWFHRTWQQGLMKETIEAGSNVIAWNPIELHWTVHPDRDQGWRDQQNALLGKKLAAQECDCDFITSGHTVIPGETLKWIQDNLIRDPIEKRGIGGDLWIWQHPDYTTKNGYLVVADVARGDGSDYSSFHVFKLSTMDQVAEYRGKVDTTTFGNMLIAISTEYDNALLVVENKTIGWATIQTIINRGYPNLFYMSKDLQYVDTEHQMSNKHYAEERNMVAGFTTSTKTRPLIISKLDEYFRELMLGITSQIYATESDYPIRIRSIRTVNELFTFNWINGKAQALEGYNDDLVMPMAIGMWVRDTALRLRQEGIDLMKQSVDSITVQRPYDGIYTKTAPTGQNPWKMQVGNEEEDLNWLLG